MGAAPKVEVRDRPEASRYELLVDREPAGFLLYSLEGGTISLDHAEVEQARRGRGLGKALAAGAIADAAARGLRIVPRCPFVVRYAARQPELSALLAQSRGG